MSLLPGRFRARRIRVIRSIHRRKAPRHEGGHAAGSYDSVIGSSFGIRVFMRFCGWFAGGWQPHGVINPGVIAPTR
jgi:hypothetical protein